MATRLVIFTFIFYSLGTSTSLQTVEVIITTKNGEIRGTREHSQPDERPFYAFRGIPYVKPPVGDLRWQDPVPYGSWRGPVFDATKFRPLCPQFDAQTRRVIGEEDCLHLNVFTPRIPHQGSDASLPVMVWFHGGGFVRGGSQSFGPEFLLREDIVLITVNYRLGTLGFLSTGDANLPGNYGMLDQVEALIWVRDNISDFGGDPDQVTIFGESAGGAITHLLSLSPLAKGLFHKVIFQSGSALCNRAIETDPWDYALLLASRVSCTSRDIKALVACLRTKSAEQLVGAANSLLKHSLISVRTSPVVDSTTRVRPFLPDAPRNLIKTKHYEPVPMMSGLMKNEGLLFTSGLFLDNVDRLSIPNYVEDELFPSVLSSLLRNKTSLDHVIDMVKKQYFGRVSFADYQTMFPRFSQVLDDAMYTGCVYESQVLHAKHTPMYAYLFTHRGELTPPFGAKTYDALIRAGRDHPLLHNGVSHADELLYLFQISGTNATYSPNDMHISKMMTRLWANFATNGIPMPNSSEASPVWTAVPSTTSDVPYFILSTTPRMSSNFRKKEFLFWTQVAAYMKNLEESSTSIKDETKLHLEI